MKNVIRNETALVLVVAALFSAGAIPVLSGFLEPSQPPAVAAVQIGDPGDDSAAAEEPATPQPRPARDGRGQKGARSRSRERSAKPAPSAPAEDAGEDDAAEAD